MLSTERLPNLTQYERIGTELPFNLTDGHAHQHSDSFQREIVRCLPDLYAESERCRQGELEARFRRAFFGLAGQASAVAHPRTQLCYSASQSIDIVAALLRSEGMSVALLQPCFDNLAALLSRRGVRRIVLSEPALDPDRLADTVRYCPADAIFVTLPNNPTGFALDPAAFERLARLCAAHGKTLVVDWTFRFFDRQDPWDQYAVLEGCGVSYLCVEDTGKTWPTLDLKCSILASSTDLYDKLTNLHEDFLLNVSPFVLRLLCEFLDDSRRRGLDASVRQPVRVNRGLLREVLRGTILVPAADHATVSVEWIRIESPTVDSLTVVRALGDAGVAVLPGDHFYWHDPDAGAGHVRIALARDTAMFARACGRLRDTVAAHAQFRQSG